MKNTMKSEAIPQKNDEFYTLGRERREARQDVNAVAK